MRIGINTRYLLAAQRTGIQSYIAGLLGGLSRVDRDNEYVFVNPRGENRQLDGLDFRRFRWAPGLLPARSQIGKILWEQTCLPWQLRREQIDLFHGLSFSIPLMGRWASVVTIYDLAFIVMSRALTLRTRIYLKALLPAVVRRAGGILVISESTRRDVIRYLGARPERVRVVYPGLDDFFRPLDEDERRRSNEVLARYGIRMPFVLTVGAVSPRKNVGTLLKALCVLIREYGIAPQLVLAGGRAWLAEKEMEVDADPDLRGHVIEIGYVPREDLRMLYNAARVLAYPSLYEGFGLPILEAMACGAPVVASATSSIPEVVGDAGILVNPRDPQAIAAAIASLWTDADLRERLARQGIVRSQFFSWDRAAAETLEMYKQVLATA